MNITPLATPETPTTRSSELHATEFTSHDGTTIVRLVPTELLKAEELALASVGLNRGDDQIVGRTITRAVGFPAWPIITDPDNAQHALNLVRHLEWAKRNAEHNPRRIKERFDELITSLTNSAPHFVPTLLEELSRIFINVGNTNFARQYFGKAREIERAYGITIDAERHAAMFTEFADFGIIGAREFTAEAKSAGERMEPQAAFDYFLQLSIARSRAGAGAYVGLARDLRKLAKAAGMSAFDADKALIEGIIEFSGFREASAGFFKSVRSSLPKIAAESARCRVALLKGRHRELSIEEYFTILHESGAFAELAADKEDLAEWLVEFIATEYGSSYYYWQRHRSQKLIDAVVLAGDHMAGKTLPLYSNSTDLDLIDALCANNIVWDLQNINYFRWSDWFDNENYKDSGASRRDLSGITHHDQLRDLIPGSIPVGLIAGNDNLNLILNMPVLRELCHKRLDRCAAERDCLTGFEPEWNQFTRTELQYLTDPRVADINAEAAEKLFSIDPVAELQARLRNGIVEELTWPAVERSMIRLLAGAPQETAVEFFETYPGVAIRFGEKIEIIDGDEVVAHGTVPADANVDAIYQVGDHVATFYHPNYRKYYSCWSGEAPVLNGKLNYYSTIPDSNSLPTPEGRLTGYGMLSYPNQLEYYGGYVLGTGPYYRYARYAEINDDAALEPVGRGESIPGVDLTGLSTSPPPVTYTFLGRQSTIIPVQPTTRDSLCGTLNDQHISIVFRGHYSGIGQPGHIWTPLGSFTSKHSIVSAIRRPGGGVWLVDDYSYRGRCFYDPETDNHMFGGTNTTNTMDYVCRLPLSAYHQLRPRDEEMSVRMRNVSYEQAAMLVESPTIEVVEQEFGADPVLGAAILQVVTKVQDLTNWLAMKGHEAEEEKPEEREVSLEASDVLWQAIPGRYANSYVRCIGMWNGGILSTLLANPGETNPELDEVMEASKEWWELLGKEKIIVVAISALSNDPGAVIELCEWLLDATEAGLFASGWQHCRLVEKSGQQTAEWRQGAWVYSYGRYYNENLHAIMRPEHKGIAELRTVTDPDQPDLSMDKQEFMDSVAAIKAWAEQRKQQVEEQSEDTQVLFGGSLLADAAAQLSNDTILLPETAKYMLHGLKDYSSRSWQSTVLDKAGRAELGFTQVAERAVLTQVRGIGDIEWLLASGVDESFPTKGINVDKMRDYLLERYGAPIMKPTVRQLNEAKKLGLFADYITHAISPNLGLPSLLVAEKAGKYLQVLLYLAHEMDLSDPNRAMFATKLVELKEFAAQQTWKGLGTMELGGDYDQKGFNGIVTHESQTIRVLLEGVLDGFVEGLGVVGGVGVGFDPCVSVPGLVVEVSEVLGVSLDCARYFLQVLALVCPSDVCVRRWNGWGSGDIRGVGEVLAGRGLLVGGRRSGAGRSWFLPGGWLSGVGGSCGVEVWKVSLFLVWGDVVFRPVVGGCPVLGSVGELFTTAWERYKNGDKPGFEEITTSRYQRR